MTQCRIDKLWQQIPEGLFFTACIFLRIDPKVAFQFSCEVQFNNTIYFSRTLLMQAVDLYLNYRASMKYIACHDDYLAKNNDLLS